MDYLTVKTKTQLLMYHSLCEIPHGEVIMKIIYMVYIFIQVLNLLFHYIVCQVLHSGER